VKKTRIVVVGDSATGPKAAAKARRIDNSAEVIILQKDADLSMASHRPYRSSPGIETALEEIEKNKGILYDNIADACLKIFREKSYQLEGA
jgi:tRNA U34 5-carboxymethylaminomethyl modifying enzyme MnmG/GidA